VIERKIKERKRNKGAWWMPRLSEAMKDVVSCEKLWGAANERRSVDIRMGEPIQLKTG